MVAGLCGVAARDRRARRWGLRRAHRYRGRAGVRSLAPAPPAGAASAGASRHRRGPRRVGHSARYAGDVAAGRAAARRDAAPGARFDARDAGGLRRQAGRREPVGDVVRTVPARDADPRTGATRPSEHHGADAQPGRKRARRACVPRAAEPAFRSRAARSVAARDACVWLAWTADHAVLQRERRARRIAHGRADCSAPEGHRHAALRTVMPGSGSGSDAASSLPSFERDKSVHEDLSDKPRRRCQRDRGQLARRPAHRPGDGCTPYLYAALRLMGIADMESAYA
ncbi:hypothetical protein F01_400120 [Burkholderia cenocepacia]|nr:hypothetical protein F01_400120 [Burkholderia cenocepacia]